MLQPLLDKCGIDAEEKVVRHSFFVDAQLGQQAGLELLTRLYVGRSYHVWKLPELLPWLERNCKAVLERVDAKEPAVADAAAKRKTRYQGVPRNIYRHVIMSDMPETTTSLPREMAETAVLSYDPLPPADSIDLYKRAGDGQGAGAGAGGGSGDNAVSLFLRSWLPNYQPGQEQ